MMKPSKRKIYSTPESREKMTDLLIEHSQRNNDSPVFEIGVAKQKSIREKFQRDFKGEKYKKAAIYIYD